MLMKLSMAARPFAWTCRFAGVTTALRQWRARRRTRRALALLDAAQLADIGITREEASSESAKPFWSK